MFYPTEIIFSVTTACNLHCSHCFINRNPQKLQISEAKAFIKSCVEYSGAATPPSGAITSPAGAALPAGKTLNSSAVTPPSGTALPASAAAPYSGAITSPAGAASPAGCSGHIEKIGFSGGEPFLYLDFLLEITKFAVANDLMFDQIMTNGCWWQTEAQLNQVLQQLYDAGYDGKIGVSWDSFHGQSIEQMETFINKTQQIFGQDSISIQIVQGGESLPLAPNAAAFSATLGSDGVAVKRLLWSVFSESRSNYVAHVLSGAHPRNAPETICSWLDQNHPEIPYYILPLTLQSEDSRAWQSKKWFKEDYCEGPGQILYVHASGNIAPCCGFANENPQLFIGKITDTFEQVLQNAASNKMVNICYNTGLYKYKKQLKKDKIKLPGKTSDICSFCDFVCKLN